MNAPDINRSILRMHVAAIEAKHPLKILGLLPHGSSGPAVSEDSLEFLAEKGSGLSLLDLVQAQLDLSDLLGRRVEIVLVSGLTGSEAADFPRLVQPL